MTSFKRKAILTGALIGGLYPIVALVLATIINRFITSPDTQAVVTATFFGPLWLIRFLFAWSDPFVHDPLNRNVCAIARDASGQVTETSLGCEVMLGFAQAAFMGAVVGALIGWLIAVIRLRSIWSKSQETK